MIWFDRWIRGIPTIDGTQSYPGTEKECRTTPRFQHLLKQIETAQVDRWTSFDSAMMTSLSLATCRWKWSVVRSRKNCTCPDAWSKIHLWSLSKNFTIINKTRRNEKEFQSVLTIVVAIEKKENQREKERRTSGVQVSFQSFICQWRCWERKKENWVLFHIHRRHRRQLQKMR